MDVTKVVKKRYINKSITVMTRKDLADALKERYANITVEGDLGVRLYKEMNGFSSKLLLTVGFVRNQSEVFVR